MIGPQRLVNFQHITMVLCTWVSGKVQEVMKVHTACSNLKYLLQEKTLAVHFPQNILLFFKYTSSSFLPLSEAGLESFVLTLAAHTQQVLFHECFHEVWSKTRWLLLWSAIQWKARHHASSSPYSWDLAPFDFWVSPESKWPGKASVFNQPRTSRDQCN